MKTMTISYRMYRNNKTEATEDSITLPVTDGYARQIMDGQNVEHLDYLLDRLAQLQGYDTADALLAYNHDGDGQDAPDPLAGADSWNPADEDWIPGEGADD